MMNHNCNNCFTGISKLNRCEILTIINSLSILLSEGLEEEDLDMLGSILSTLGDIISTFAVIAPEATASEEESTSN